MRIFFLTIPVLISSFVFIYFTGYASSDNQSPAAECVGNECEEDPLEHWRDLQEQAVACKKNPEECKKNCHICEETCKRASEDSSSDPLYRWECLSCEKNCGSNRYSESLKKQPDVNPCEPGFFEEDGKCVEDPLHKWRQLQKQETNEQQDQ